MSIGTPSAVNAFPVESDAHVAAAEWSRDPSRPEWTIIHAPSESSGLVYYVEPGDGGMVRNTETLVARYVRGKKQKI